MRAHASEQTSLAIILDLDRSHGRNRLEEEGSKMILPPPVVGTPMESSSEFVLRATNSASSVGLLDEQIGSQISSPFSSGNGQHLV